MQADLRVDASRLAASIDELATIGAVEGGGVCRTAASDEDRRARDLVVSWMRTAGLDVKIDAVGNVFGIRAGDEDGPPVMTGSHLDTVKSGDGWTEATACCRASRSSAP